MTWGIRPGLSGGWSDPPFALGSEDLDPAVEEDLGTKTSEVDETVDETPEEEPERSQEEARWTDVSIEPFLGIECEKG